MRIPFLNPYDMGMRPLLRIEDALIWSWFTFGPIWGNDGSDIFTLPSSRPTLTFEILDFEQ